MAEGARTNKSMDKVKQRKAYNCQLTVLFNCESVSHCVVDRFAYFSGGLHQCWVGGAKKTMPNWNHAIGNLSRAIRMDILNCHFPKSPIVSCRMSVDVLEKVIPEKNVALRSRLEPGTSCFVDKCFGCCAILSYKVEGFGFESKS